MSRIILALVAGLGLGGAIGYLAAVKREAPPPQPVRDIAEVPKMTAAIAEQHREKRYADLGSIEDVQALPSAFARNEALYALAGRSDASRVQDLIFDANRIADEVERLAALTVLFYRLGELDPPSALALARTDYFRGVRAFEQTVWRAWGRMDLDAALFAAKTQTSAKTQNSAAQGLYAAFGFMGNETTDRIEAELGVRPDRATRSSFLYRLADHSPADAVAFINEMERGPEQQEYVWWLAYYLSLSDPQIALAQADLFDNPADRDRYRNMVRNTAAAQDPQATIERILAEGSINRNRGEFYSAMRALASKDSTLVMGYFNRAQSQDEKQAIGRILADKLADEDPALALQWARANDKGDYPHLEMAVLGGIAERDPQYAIAEAQTGSNPQLRRQIIANVVSSLVRSDPVQAAGLVALIDSPQLRRDTESQLVQAWMRTDSDAALEWVLAKDDATAAQLLADSQWALLRTDLDAAIRVLPHLEEHQQHNWRSQIAERLATTRSVAEAQAFVRGFEGQPGYEQLQSTVISSLARTDVGRARLMASELTDSKARDSAYAQIAGITAETDPQAALAMLPSIASQHYRGMATGQIAANWYQENPAAATRWVSGLPAGAARDDAIMYLSGHWQEHSPAQQALLDSIGDDDKRGQAKLRQVYALMRTDPERARTLLDDPDIPSYRRQQIEAMLKQGGVRF